MIPKLRRIPIRFKVLGMGLGVVALFTLYVFGYQIPAYRQSLMNKKKEALKDVVRISLSLVSAAYEKQKSGELSSEEAKAFAISQIKSLRYGEDTSNYIWINDLSPRMIMHPYRPDLNGTDISQLKDPLGLPIFVKMAEVVKNQREGYVEYMWQHYDDADKIVPKVSYVAGFQEWGWILGSGIYIEDIREELNRVSWISAGIVLFIIVFSSGILVLATKRLLDPIDDLKRTAHQMAEGDIRSNINIQSGDEFEDLNDSFNSLMVNLRSILEESLQVSDRLSRSTEEMNTTINRFSDNTGELSAVVEEITGTVEEVTASMDMVASGAESQNRSLQKLIETVNDLSSTIRGLGSKVKETLAESDTISESARTGETSLQEMSGSMARVSKSSEDMVRIVNIINDISDRINLLSLNAAIEAARAGDSGRGFAVVSDEISRLADETARSIKEISEIIARNNSDIEKSMKITAGSIDGMHKVIVGVGRIHDLMNTIYGFVEKEVNVNELMNKEMDVVRIQSEEIKNSTGEQKKAISEISLSISSINEMTQAAATGSQELAEESGVISRLAGRLKNKINFFKV